MSRVKALVSCVALCFVATSSAAWADWATDVSAAKEAMKRKDYDTAIQIYTTELADHSLSQNRRSIAHNNRGSAYSHKDLYDQALADFTEALRLNPAFPEAHYNRGNDYAKKGLNDLAIADYTEAVRQKPDNPNAFYNRGNVYVQKGQYDQAIADYTEALRLKPDNQDALQNRGAAFDQKGLYDEAVADLTEALRLRPEDPDAHSNRGFAYAHKGLYDRALRDYTEAIRLKPDFTDAITNRGRTNLFRGDFKKAADDFARALRDEPGDAYNVIWYYVALRRSGSDGARELTDAATHVTSPDWPKPIIDFYLGTVSRDRLVSAAGSLDAKKQVDQQCEAWTYLAEADLMKGDARSAAALFQQAADKCPTDDEEKLLAEVELTRLQAALGHGR